MIQSQLMAMSHDAVWRSEMDYRRERISRLYGKQGGRRRVPARPGLRLPRRRRHAVAVA